MNITISKRPMSTKFGKQVHVEDLIQMKLIKQVLVKSSYQGHITKEKHFISTTRVAMPIAIKFGKIPPMETYSLLIT